MPRQTGWSTEANLLYQLKQLQSRASGGGSSTPAVETYATYSAFPVTGTAGVFYVDSATGIEYVWNGTTYTPLQQGVTPNFPTIVQNGKINNAASTTISPRFPSVYFTSVAMLPYIGKTYPDVTRGYKAFGDMVSTGTALDSTTTTHTVSNFELLYLGQSQALTPTHSLGFTTITYSDLKYIIGASGSSLSMGMSLNITDINFPELIACTTQLTIPVGAVGPLNLNVPKVEFIQNLSISAGGINSLNFPELLQINSISISSNSNATSYSFPKLKWLGQMSMSGSSNVTTISFPSIEVVTGNLTMHSTATSLVNFTFGSSLKFFAGNFVTTSNSLNQASVDNILIRLAALDGTNGTILFSSRTVTITGTSATPSAAGLAAKNTLIARGCTVTTN